MRGSYLAAVGLGALSTPLGQGVAKAQAEPLERFTAAERGTQALRHSGAAAAEAAD